MEWTTIAHAPGYELRQDGLVRNKKTGKVLKQHTNPSGYLIVCLHGSSKGRTFLVHRLIAEQFVSGHRDDLEVNHKDGDKLNNALDNLEWVTRRENQMHRIHQLGRKAKMHTLTEDVVRRLVAFRNDNLASMSVTGQKFGVHATMVCAIFTGKAWGHLWPDGKPECNVPRNLRKSGSRPTPPVA